MISASFAEDALSLSPGMSLTVRITYTERSRYLSLSSTFIDPATHRNDKGGIFDMTKKINRLTHTAKRYSKRTVAMILSVIMLISALFTGSMLNTFAAYMSDNALADGSALTEAATEGSDIALNAVPDEDADDVDSEDGSDETDEGPFVVNGEVYDDAADAAKAEALSDFEENKIVKGLKEDLADTGANVDLAESGWYNLENGARVYFNSYERGSGAGTGNNVKKYVYMAIICNDHYYQIIKMDHIANSELYTCYTSSANINTASDVNGIVFFSSDASGWGV